MTIRSEREADWPKIAALVEAAFATAPHADGDERFFVERLRRGDRYVPDLALVREDNGALVAHVMLTRLTIAATAGPNEVLMLAPVSVAPDRQRRGLGTRLVREALARAEALGHGAAVVLGDPAYYSRFGFRASVAFGLLNSNGFAKENVMALELRPGALEVAAGVITFPKSRAVSAALRLPPSWRRGR